MKCKFEWYKMPCDPNECNFVYCEYNANRVFTVEGEKRTWHEKVKNNKDDPLNEGLGFNALERLFKAYPQLRNEPDTTACGCGYCRIYHLQLDHPELDLEEFQSSISKVNNDE